MLGIAGTAAVLGGIGGAVLVATGTVCVIAAIKGEKHMRGHYYQPEYVCIQWNLR